MSMVNLIFYIPQLLFYLEGANIKLSGTVSDINGKSAHNILEYLLTGASMDEAKYDEMYKQKIIAHNLKATKEQIIDNLNGVMNPLQRRMMLDSAEG